LLPEPGGRGPLGLEALVDGGDLLAPAVEEAPDQILVILVRRSARRQGDQALLAGGTQREMALESTAGVVGQRTVQILHQGLAIRMRHRLQRLLHGLQNTGPRPGLPARPAISAPGEDYRPDTCPVPHKGWASGLAVSRQVRP